MQVSNQQPAADVGTTLYQMYENTGKLIVFYNADVVDEEPLAGLAIDAGNLQEAGKDVGFEVKTYPNMKRQQLFDKLDEYANMDHSKYTCFAVAITTHGGGNEVLWASDEDEYDASYYLREVLDKFRGKNCPALKGKPKLFFIDACRGSAEDRGAPHTSTQGTVATGPTEETKSKILTVPVEADFLVAHSSCPDYYATSEAEIGSIFIRNLCAVLQNDQLSNLIDMLTNVNDMTANESCRDGDIQMPSFTTQLTASLQLRQPSGRAQMPEL